MTNKIQLYVVFFVLAIFAAAGFPRLNYGDVEGSYNFGFPYVWLELVGKGDVALLPNGQASRFALSVHKYPEYILLNVIIDLILLILLWNIFRIVKKKVFNK